MNIVDNQVRQLPDSIGRLGNLRVLLLGRNRLTTLPASILKLERLERLGLHPNPWSYHDLNGSENNSPNSVPSLRQSASMVMLQWQLPVEITEEDSIPHCLHHWLVSPIAICDQCKKKYHEWDTVWTIRNCLIPAAEGYAPLRFQFCSQICQRRNYFNLDRHE
jgi:hypothetical protein